MIVAYICLLIATGGLRRMALMHPYANNRSVNTTTIYNIYITIIVLCKHLQYIQHPD